MDSAANIQKSLSNFSFQLNHLLPSSQNIVFSPLSIYLALSMAAIGSEGQSLSEFQKILKFHSRQALAQSSQHLQQCLTLKNQGIVNEIANKIYLGISNARKEFLDIMKNNYSSGIEQVDFTSQPDKIRLSINQWVEDVTKGKIQNLLDSGTIDHDTKMVLINAIYFKGEWEKAFQMNFTRKADFRLSYQGNDDKVLIDMMYQEDNKDYFENDHFQYVQIPYKGGDYAMEIILPKNKLQDFEKKFENESLEEARQKACNLKITLSLPKFKIAGSSINLKEILLKVGLIHPFSDAADFSFMDPAKSIKVDTVIHKAMIEVNEEGAEAAAATAVIMAMRCMIEERVPNMVCDHPFMFTIIHKPTKTLMFLGKVINPSQN